MKSPIVFILVFSCWLGYVLGVIFLQIGAYPPICCCDASASEIEVFVCVCGIS